MKQHSSRHCDDTIELAILYFKYIALGYEIAINHKASFYFCLYPKIQECFHPSDLERYLMTISYEDSGSDASKTYVGERIPWLKSFPPHLRNIYSEIPDLCNEYINDIFSGPGIYTNPDGLCIQHDFSNNHVHVENGFRRTTGCPDVFENTVHIFGPSYVYGFGAEDDHTIPSLFQSNHNAFKNSQPSARCLRVSNHGTRGGTYDTCLKHISQARLAPGDTVIVFDSNLPLSPSAWDSIRTNGNVSDRLIELCTAAGIPVIDFRPMFHRPHVHGEVFFDNGHMAHRGNLALARKLHDVCIRSGDLWRQEDRLATHFLLQNKLLGKAETENNIHAYRGLQDYLNDLKDKSVPSDNIGCIVMNCNPFTQGHQNLIKTAASQVDHLYIFVVQENRSCFSFNDRLVMTTNGCRSLDNVTVLPGGQYIISTLTFPEYFEKDHKKDLTINASMDIHVFGKFISKTLNISKRFVGQEPFCPITRQYNQQMLEILPEYGIAVLVIERFKVDDTPISASQVRRLMGEGQFEQIGDLVPKTTYDHLVAIGKIPRQFARFEPAPAPSVEGQGPETMAEHLLRETIPENRTTLKQPPGLRENAGVPVTLSTSDRGLLSSELVCLFHDLIAFSKYPSLAAYLKMNFNEAHYLTANPDVSAAIADGRIHSGLEHWLTWGFQEGRSVSFFQTK